MGPQLAHELPIWIVMSTKMLELLLLEKGGCVLGHHIFADRHDGH